MDREIDRNINGTYRSPQAVDRFQKKTKSQEVENFVEVLFYLILFYFILFLFYLDHQEIEGYPSPMPVKIELTFMVLYNIISPKRPGHMGKVLNSCHWQDPSLSTECSRCEKPSACFSVPAGPATPTYLRPP